jgi:hypothetical protein
MALADQSTEKLLKTQKLLKSIIIAYAILVFVSAVVLALVKAKPLHFMPASTFILVMLPVIINLNAIKKELKLRSDAAPK